MKISVKGSLGKVFSFGLNLFAIDLMSEPNSARSGIY
jgi:hypothetical protein